MTLTGEEFLRRFLLHALPDRFVRIRYYGPFANRYWPLIALFLYFAALSREGIRVLGQPVAL